MGYFDNMWTIRVLILVTCAAGLIQWAAAVPDNQTARPSIFQDDFSLDRLDGSKWNAADLKSAVNQERQYYSPDNVRTASGALVVTVRAEARGGANYTSGRVDTRDHYTFTYGRVEIRAQMPKGRGIWASLWLAHSSCLPAVPCAHWPPAISLIDFRGDRANRTDSTLHFKANDSAQYTSKSYFGPADLTADWHTYVLRWSPSRLACSVDGQEHFAVDDPSKIPSAPMQLVINVAVGGHYAGAPDSSTQLPTQMLVDYVKITSLDDDTATGRSTGAGHSAHCFVTLVSLVITSAVVNRLLI